jgi:hypothetical protein
MATELELPEGCECWPEFMALHLSSEPALCPPRRTWGVVPGALIAAHDALHMTAAEPGWLAEAAAAERWALCHERAGRILHAAASRRTMRAILEEVAP